MNTNRKITWMFAALVIGEFAVADQPPAKPDQADWACNFCTYAAGWFGSLDFGPGYASEADLKFADYRGMEDKGAFISAYGDVHYRNKNGHYFDIYARDLGTDSRQLEMRGGSEGRFEIRLDYSEIPKYRGFGATTPYRAAGNSQLVLPVGWVQASTTAGMSALDNSLVRADLHTLRKDFDAGLSLKLSGNWRYEVELRHMEKDGTRPFATGVFTIQSSYFPAPVDFTTDRLEMGLEYAGERARMRVGFMGSWFSNGNDSVTWENPFTPIGNTQLLRAALEPDSDFQQFNFTGVFQASPSVRISGNAAVGRIKQDSNFLPYSINPDFDGLLLPRQTLAQKIDSSTINLASRLTSRLTRKLKLTARIKIDERDNRTPVLVFTPVITDLVPRPKTSNRPYSFERNRFSAELSYRANNSVNILGGVKRLDHQRSLQSVRETQDSTWWGEININRWANAQLRLRMESSERDISPYEQVSDTGLQENVLMRKFSLAGRERERAIIELDLSPTNRLSAGFSYYRSEDDYEQSVLGLLNSEERSLGFDFGYTLSNKLSLHLFVTQDRYDSAISAAPSPFSDSWTATTQDRFTTLGGGLKGSLGDRMQFSLNYVSSESSGRIHTNSGSGEAPFPELQTDLHNARVQLNYKVNEQWSWILFAEHENYRSADWQVDDLGNDGISAILTFGIQSPHYSANLLRLMANYRF